VGAFADGVDGVPPDQELGVHAALHGLPKDLREKGEGRMIKENEGRMMKEEDGRRKG
jgi:hypothetical protein